MCQHISKELPNTRSLGASPVALMWRLGALKMGCWRVFHLAVICVTFIASRELRYPAFGKKEHHLQTCFGKGFLCRLLVFWWFTLSSKTQTWQTSGIGSGDDFFLRPEVAISQRATKEDRPTKCGFMANLPGFWCQLWMSILSPLNSHGK